MPNFWRTSSPHILKTQWFSLSILIFGQNSCFLVPKIFKIPQPNWYSAPVAPAAPVVEGYYPIEKAEVPAPEEIENSLDDEGVVSLKKREANAEPLSHGYESLD